MAIVGLVPAAGYARRLAGAVDGSKEVQPVGGRPVMTYLLDRLRAGGATRIVVTTRADKPDVVELASASGAEVVLGEPATLGASLRLAATGLDDDDLVLFGFPDSIWTPADGFLRLVEAVEDGEPIVLGIFESDHPERSEGIALDPDGRLRDIVGPSDPRTAPLIWGIGAARVAVLRTLLADEEPGPAFARHTATAPIATVRLGRILDVGVPDALRRADRDPVVVGPDASPVPDPSSAISRRRRVLHVARRYAPMVGGIERYVLDVATAQARRRDPTRVVTLRRDVLGVHTDPLPPRDRLDGVDVIRLPGIGNQRFGVCLRPDVLARAIRSADVVHLHDLRFMVGFSVVVARMTGRPLVYHTHGLLAHTTFASGLKRLLMRGYYGPLLRFGRAVVVASSEHDRELLLADVPALAARTRTVENAVDLRRFLAHGRATVPGRILVIGRVAERKGIDRLLDALRVLASRPDSPEWELVVAGTEDPAERARLDAIIDGLGLGSRIRFLGGYTDEEHPALLASASVAVFPSRAEGFGLALLEAMASGTPVIASDLPTHHVLLGSAAPDALVDADDPDAFADRIGTALALAPADREAIGDRLRGATDAYDIERLIDDIEALYDEFGLTPRIGRQSQT